MSVEKYRRKISRRDGRELGDFSDEIDSADCSPDGKLLLTGYDGGAWELTHLDRSDTATHLILAHQNGTILAAVFAPDGKRFATGGWDAMIRLWSLDGTCLRTLFGHGYPIQSLTWSTDGKRLLSRCRDGSMRVWSVATGRPELIFTPLADGTSAILTADGTQIGGSETGIRETFLFLEEKPSGAMQILDSADFMKRAGLVKP